MDDDVRPRDGRRVGLRLVTPEDYSTFYKWSVDPRSGYRARYRGMTPPPEAFVTQLWNGVLAQYAVVKKVSGELVGVVALYGANLRDGYAYISALGEPSRGMSGLLIEAVALIVDYGFYYWDFRKLYAETPSHLAHQFGSASQRWVQEEGRLRRHEWHDGELRDLVTLALYRDAWMDFVKAFPRLLSPSESTIG